MHTIETTLGHPHTLYLSGHASQCRSLRRACPRLHPPPHCVVTVCVCLFHENALTLHAPLHVCVCMRDVCGQQLTIAVLPSTCPFPIPIRSLLAQQFEWAGLFEVPENSYSLILRKTGSPPHYTIGTMKVRHSLRAQTSTSFFCCAVLSPPLWGAVRARAHTRARARTHTHTHTHAHTLGRAARADGHDKCKQCVGSCVRDIGR
jgi:hypothetical protein